MSFNLEKYLVENNLTLISRKRQALKEEEDQPSDADVKSAEKDPAIKHSDKKAKRQEEIKKEIAKITADMKELAKKYKTDKSKDTVDQLKKLTAKKKDLEKELDKIKAVNV